MTDEPKKIRLTPAEARRKWGELVHGPTRTYLHFEEAGGMWRPEVRGGELVSYGWQKLRPEMKGARWRRKR